MSDEHDAETRRRGDTVRETRGRGDRPFAASPLRPVGSPPHPLRFTSHASRLTPHGFTLIEAMLATLLLTVGMIAIAGMIEMSLGRNVGANQISLVTNLAADMVERIQFNRRNVTAYGGIDTLNIATRPASSQMMAQGDYDQWGARLTASGLGNVQGLVTVATVGPTNPPLNQSQVTVRINWSGSVRTHTLTVSTIVAPE